MAPNTGMYDTFLRQFSAVGVDVVTVLLYAYGSGWLAARFQAKSPFNAVVIALLYGIFCISVYLLLKLPASEGTEVTRPGTFQIVTAACFGAMVGFMMAETAGVIGYINRMDVSSTGTGTSLLFLGGALFFILVVVIYPTILVVAGKSAAGWQGSSLSMIETLSLLGINLMIVATVAGWDASFAGTEPYDSIAIGGKILIFVVTYAFFFFFFAAPRLIYVMRRPGWIAIVTFLLQSGWFVWHSVARHAWR